MTERLLTAFAHTWLALAIGLLACLALRRATPSLRCWVWRTVLTKSLLALLIAIPVVVAQNPLSPPGEREGPPKEATKKPSEQSPLESPLRWIGVRGPAKPVTESVAGDTYEFASQASRTLVTEPEPTKPNLLPTAYALGLLATLTLKTLRARRPHRAMPRVVGAFRPRILIPDGLTPEAAAMARAHEAAHVRRRDPLWSLVADLCCTLLWFAPPIWFAAAVMRAEAEAACDAEAVRQTGAPPRAYAQLLLAFAGPAPANALGGPARRLARRILMLDQTSKPLSRTLTIALLAVGAVALIPWRAEAQTASPAVSKPAHPAAPKPAQKTKKADNARERARLEAIRAEIAALEAQQKAMRARTQAMRKDLARSEELETRRALELERTAQMRALQAKRRALYATQDELRANRDKVRYQTLSVQAREVEHNANRWIYTGDVVIEGKKADDLPAAGTPAGPIMVVQRGKQTIFVYRDGDKPPFRYRIETHRIKPVKPAELKAEPIPIQKAWTEPLLRQLLRVDTTTLDYRPDPDRPGTELATVEGNDHLIYRISRTKTGDDYHYDVKAAKRIRVASPKPDETAGN